MMRRLVKRETQITEYYVDGGDVAGVEDTAETIDEEAASADARDGAENDNEDAAPDDYDEDDNEDAAPDDYDEDDAEAPADDDDVPVACVRSKGGRVFCGERVDEE